MQWDKYLPSLSHLLLLSFSHAHIMLMFNMLNQRFRCGGDVDTNMKIRQVLSRITRL